MKTILSIFFILFCFNASNAQETNPKVVSSNYCLLVKGDTEVLMRDGKEITTDIKLESGDQLSPSGRIIKRDGTEVKLKEGDCVTENGEVIRHEK